MEESPGLRSEVSNIRLLVRLNDSSILLGESSIP